MDNISNNNEANSTMESGNSNDSKTWRTSQLFWGVVSSCITMFLVCLLLYFPTYSTQMEGNMNIRSLLLFFGYFVLMIALGFVSVWCFCGGIKKYANSFESGGRRSLTIVYWAYLVALAGLILHLLVYKMLPGIKDITFLHLLVGNSLLIVASVMMIVGFLSFATAKHLHQNSRKGAVNMLWVIIVLLVAAFLDPVALQGGLALKVFCTVVALFGIVSYYLVWKTILFPTLKNELGSEETEVN